MSSESHAGASKVFVSSHALILHKLSKLRGVETGPKKFRELIRELAMLLAYEATIDLDLVPMPVTTPMGETEGHALSQKVAWSRSCARGWGWSKGSGR